MILAVLLALTGVGTSVLLLTHLRGRKETAPPLTLRGWDFLVAAVLWLGTPVFWMAAVGMEENLAHPVALLVIALGAVLAWAWFGFRSGALWPVAEGPPAPLSWGIRCALASAPGFFSMAYCASVAGEWWAGGPVQQEVVAGLRELPWPLPIPSFLLAVLVLPILEEVLFRGWLWGFLTSRKDFGPRRALLITTLAFTLAHEPVAWLPIFFLGGVLGWMRWQSGKLRHVILLHVLYNGVGSLLALTQDSSP